LNGEPAGCGALRRLDADSFEIKRMFVAPRWRGLGVGESILTVLEEHAARLGARRLVLETGERQPRALRLYEGRGYQRTAPFGEYVGSPLSVCLEKVLPHQS
jgi:GNAT superfamily N-acetyltransferase